MTLRRRITFFAASLPERIVRAGAAVLGGTVHETAELLLPRIARRSRLYEASAKNLLRIMIEGVGSVDRPKSDEIEPDGPAPKELAIRKGAGNVVELGSIAAFGFSPLWLLAAVADITRGSRVYLRALTDELKAAGVIQEDVDVSSVDELLGVLEGTSGRTARLIDIPPLELAGLRSSIWELGEEATDLPSQAQLARLYDGLRRTAAAEDRPLLEVSQGIGMAFVTSARKVSRTHIAMPYREDWQPVRDEGFAAYACRVSRPYGEAAASHFQPERQTFTERALSRIPNDDKSSKSFSYCDEFDYGFGWIAKDKLRRTSHALKTRGEVWIFDPLMWEPALERIRELGEPAGVVQLLDRHERDAAEVASALGVPHYSVPLQGIAASPLEILPLVRSRFWREVAVWMPELRALVVADALGTVGYFRAAGEPIGVHPFLRVKPPKTLARYEPRHILVGHGKGIHGEDTPEALREALRTARRRLPKAWLGMLRRG